MYCPNCNQEYDGRFCPECGTKLIEKPFAQGGFNLNLGDANAISGGIHLQDRHDVTNIDNSVHNITNNTSTVNNITNVAAQKTEMELLQERKTQYLNACKRAFEDNVLDSAEEVELEELRIKLNLDKTTANSIIESVKVMSERNARKTSLNPIAKIKLKKLSDNIQNNEVKDLVDQIDSFASLVRTYDHDELTRKYYLVLAALKSEKCIELKENSKIDNYWESFWSYLAYIKVGCLKQAEDVLVSLEHFTNYPEDNINVLAVAGSLITGNMEMAKEFLTQIIGDYTPALQRFVDSIYLLLEPEIAEEMGADENTCAFYLVNFFGQKDTKVEAENLQKAEELVKMGKDYEWDDEEKKAAECYEKAAKLGFARGIYHLGACYWCGTGVDQDFNRALCLFNEAAEKNDILALDKLASIYRNGDEDEGLAEDADKAADFMYKIYEVADEEIILDELESDYYESVLALGKELLNNENPSKALDLFKVVASLHDLSWEGLDEAKEEAKKLIQAEKYYEEGADNIVFEGFADEDDYIKAVELFKKAADLGHVLAQLKLGDYYKKGYGVEQDFEQALYWYDKASDQYNLKAKNELMKLYSKTTLGDGIFDDEPNKYMDLFKAAEMAEWIMDHADDKLISETLDDSWYYGVYVLGKQLWNMETDDPYSSHKANAVSLLRSVANIAEDTNSLSNNNEAKEEAQAFLREHDYSW